MGGRDAVRVGGGLDAPGLWPSQAVVATERVALLYAIRFHSESAALTGLGAVRLGDPQARATPSPNARRRCRSAVSANTVISSSIRRYATPMGGYPEKCVPIPLGWGSGIPGSEHHGPWPLFQTGVPKENDRQRLRLVRFPP